MLDMGESKLSDDLKPRVTLKCADVLQLELRQHSFDLVVSSFGMRHIRECELIVKKIGTWLIPRGRLIVLDFFKPETVLSRVFQATAGRHILPAGRTAAPGF